MSMELLAPSEALSGKFDLQESDAARTVDTGKSKQLHTHAFAVGDYGLLLPPDSVAEVTEELAVCRMPNTPAGLLGMVNLRGNIVPVFDMFDLLGLDQKETGDSLLLFIRLGEEWVGTNIGELPTRIALGEESKLNQLPNLPVILQPWVQTCYQKEGIWVEWDLNGFFTSLGERM